MKYLKLIPLIFLSIVLLYGCQTKQPVKMGVSLNVVDSAALKALDVTQGVRPEIWGAKGDGVTDCTWALNECWKYCNSLSRSKGITNLTILLTGIYRITDSWVIGTKYINEIYCFKYTIDTALPTYSFSNFMLSRYAPIISIEGKGRAGIYADFDAPELKAAILYDVNGDTRNFWSIQLYNAEIKNIGIYAKGYFDAKGAPARKINYTNNLCGLMCLMNNGLSVTGCTIFGFKEGFVQNYSYFSNVANIEFSYCERGFYSFGSASGMLTNSRFTSCKKAAEIRSSQYHINTLYTTACPISLHIGCGSILGSNIYCEGNNTGEAQVIVGDNPGDPFFVSDSKGQADRNWLIDGLVFNVSTVVANKSDKTPGVSFLLKETARRIYLNAGSSQSSSKIFSNTNNKIFVQGVLGFTPNANTTIIN